ncbi:hypothetical protein Btru_020630 [Bulinus truncatus]|nr:hypothetical protein Btru_020630 [Bulinus truncatus]
MYHQGRLIKALESILLTQDSPWSPYFRELSGSKLTPIDALTLGLAFMYGGVEDGSPSGVRQLEQRLKLCDIRETSDFQGKCDIGENCEIRENCNLRENSDARESCDLGENCGNLEISNIREKCDIINGSCVDEERDLNFQCDIPNILGLCQVHEQCGEKAEEQCDMPEQFETNERYCDFEEQFHARDRSGEGRLRDVIEQRSRRHDQWEDSHSSEQCPASGQQGVTDYCDPNGHHNTSGQSDTLVQADPSGLCDVREVNNNDSDGKEGAAMGHSLELYSDVVYYKAKFLMKIEDKMNVIKSKVKVDESEPNYYEEAPFERRDVLVKKDKWVTDMYTVDSLLGKGKFGEVKRCRERRTGRQLAAKFIEVNGPQDRLDVLNEVEIMKHLQHPRLLQLYDAFEKKEKFCLVMELVNGGELFERVINDDFILTEKACVMFMRQICDGVAFMHSQSILHLDMKPENILCLTREGNRIKIIDFGLARKYHPRDDLRVLFGTPEFVAPEVVNFDPIFPATDMWSVGVICYVLLSGLSPFMGESESETLSNVTMARWDFSAEEFESISNEAKDFITKLLVKDPRKRISASDCLEHQWLRRSVKREGNLLERSLSKKRLRKFVYRRKWQKAINAMLALRRMDLNICIKKKNRNLIHVM